MSNDSFTQLAGQYVSAALPREVLTLRVDGTALWTRAHAASVTGLATDSHGVWRLAAEDELRLHFTGLAPPDAAGDGAATPCGTVDEHCDLRLVRDWSGWVVTLAQADPGYQSHAAGNGPGKLLQRLPADE